MRSLLVILIYFILVASCKQSGKSSVYKEEIIANINFESSGCFSYRKETVVVSRKGATMFAVLSIGGSRHGFVKLKAQQIKVFEQFISQLKSLKEETGCTTTDTYKVHYTNQTINKIDGSCDWNGYDSLRSSLFKNY